MSIPVYRLKPAFVALLRPLARGLAAAGVTANQVTAAACSPSSTPPCWGSACCRWRPRSRPA